MPAFYFRVLGMFFYTFILFVYWKGIGDGINYLMTLNVFDNAINYKPAWLWDAYTNFEIDKKNPINAYFRLSKQGAYTLFMLKEPRAFAVVRLAYPFYTLFNNNFICASLCITTLSFLGAWQMFKAFYQMYPHLKRKLVIATMFLPSTVFWSTSILKDSFCFMALGFVFNILTNIYFHKKLSLKNIVLLIFFGAILYFVKSYILYALLGAFGLMITFNISNKFKNKTVRIFSRFSTIAVVALVSIYFVRHSESFEGGDATKYIGNITTQSQKFDSEIRKMEMGTRSNIKGTSNFFMGLVNTFMRPFLWDIGSVAMLLAIAESFFITLLLIKLLTKVKFKRMLDYILSDPFLLFSISFALVFGAIIGMATPNLGALSRYKIPVLPFFIASLAIIMDKSGKFSKQYFFPKLRI